MKLDIKNITVDEILYPRKSVSTLHVNRLASALLTGAKLPPLVIEASTHRLVDGRHRYEAYQQLEIEQVEVKEKTYATEADLYADSVRLNIGHGEPLDHYSIQNAIIRLEQYGYQRAQISEVVRLPFDRIEKIKRGFASTESGETVAVKGGLSHLRGGTLTAEQQERNRAWSGGKATFHAKQLRELLQNNMWPQTSAFSHEMDQIVALWQQIRKAAPSTAA